MSDSSDRDPPERIYRSPAEIVEHNTAKHASNPCEACGASEWSLLGDESRPAMALLPVSSDGVVDRALSSYFPVTALVCRHCGVMRFYATEALVGPEAEPESPGGA